MTIHVSEFGLLAQSRRSIRAYTEKEISHELITEILEIACWSPSAHNRQPWRFVAITTSDKQHQLATAMGNQLRRDLEADGVPEDIIELDTKRSYLRITSAPALICVCMSMIDMDTYPDQQRFEHEKTMTVQSTAMAGQTLLLAAHAVGLGACWMCAPLFCGDIVRDVLALPNDWLPQGLITLGYPAQERSRTRHPLESRILWR